MARTPKPGRGERPLSARESELWRQVMDDVTPLTPEHRAPPPSDAGVTPQTPQTPPAGKRRPPPPPAAPPPPPVRPRLPALGHDAQPGLDKRMAARLRRGQLAVEGRIDLHGLTQDEAHRALDAFLAASANAGRRVVLVITGKGLRPDGEIGVLRQAVPRWLNEAPSRGRVLAFSHAASKDGGRGALYVMLKRKNRGGR